jgi:lipopolysaccharide transport system permease protein
MVIMFLTPVLYPVPQSGIAGLVAKTNPLTPLVVSTRDWLTIGGTAYSGGFAFITALALLFLLLGWVTFRVAMPHLIPRFGN